MIFRILDEETAMHKEFGGEWESYCHRSWRLIPYIY
jgi:protein-S-isoprenylcysteine O-methyltransferase Ste14